MNKNDIPSRIKNNDLSAIQDIKNAGKSIADPLCSYIPGITTTRRNNHPRHIDVFSVYSISPVLANALMIAAHEGSANYIDALVAHGGNVNREDVLGRTPIMYATFSNNSDTLRSLIRHGANIHATNKKGHTALHIAATLGNSDCVRELIGAGADMSILKEIYPQLHHLIERDALFNQAGPFPKSQKATKERNKLIESVFFGCVKENDIHGVAKCIELGVDVHAVNDRNYTALHIAAKKGFIDIIDLLIDNAADINNLKNGYSPAAYAIFGNQMSALRRLIERGANPQPLKNTDGLLVTAVAHADRNDKEILQYVMSLDIKMNSELYTTVLAAETLDRDEFSALIKRGANIEQKDDQDDTPLIKAIKKRKFANADLLLKKGCDITHANREGHDALFFAIEHNDSQSITTIINRLKTEYHSAYDYTKALHHAARKNDLGTIEKLIALTSNIKARGYLNGNLAHAAAVSGNPDLIDKVVELGVRIDLKNTHGKTPLMLAAENNDQEMAKALYAHGAKIECLDSDAHENYKIIRTVLEAEKLKGNVRKKTKGIEQGMGL